MVRCIRWVVGLCLLAFGVVPARAAVWRVRAAAPGPAHDGSTWQTAFATVQAGLQAAAPGDEVWVAAGTYDAPITLKAGVGLYGGFAGTESAREARDPAAHVTVLNGRQVGTVVTAPPGAGPDTVLNGFTVTNGMTRPIGAEGRMPGSAVDCNAASPTLSHNVITGNLTYGDTVACRNGAFPILSDNTITGNGGANTIGCYASSPYIYRNTLGGGQQAAIHAIWNASPVILGNDIHGSQYGIRVNGGSPAIAGNHFAGLVSSDGTAVVCGGGSTPWIYANDFVGNSGSAAGAVVVSASTPTILNNRFIGNSGTSAGAIFVSGGTGTVANNLIVHNYARGGAGGIWCEGNFLIANNTLVGNVSGSNPEYRVGTLYVPSGAPRISNNLIAFNSSGVSVAADLGGAPSFRANDVYGNGDFDYRGVRDPTGRDGNVQADPRLANPTYGDFRIQPDSPCRDAGILIDVAGDTDFAGSPRIADDNVDIGAYEAAREVLPAEPMVVRVRPDGDDARAGDSWPNAKKTIAAALAAISARGGGEVWIAAGDYNENVTLGSFTRLYGGFEGKETARGEANPSAHISLLDGGGDDDVIAMPRGTVAAVVDGLSITNGVGGIHAPAASVSITRNVVRANAVPGTGGAATDRFGLFVAGFNNVVRDNDIRDNIGGTGVVCGGQFTLDHNRISGNDGGAYCGGSYAERPLVVRNVISGNAGTGLVVDGQGPAEIANNAITGNEAEGWGGGMYCMAPALVHDNLIANNVSHDWGGGILSSASGVSYINNTIVGNRATEGGGMLFWFWTVGMVANNIVAFNSSGLNAQYDPQSVIPLFNNCVFGNTAYDFGGIPNPTGTAGNLRADPLFVDRAAGDFHLTSDSPCRDAGDDDWTQRGWTDMDGKPRIQGLRVDLGAYESPGPARILTRDILAALRQAGGLSATRPDDATTLNRIGGPKSGVDILDAVALARAAAGLSAEP